MKVDTIINKKDNKPYTTEDGIECQSFMLEVGDVILPQMDRPKFIKAHGAIIYDEHKLLVKCKSKGKDVVLNNQGEDDLYIRISRTMFNQLNGLIEKANMNIKSTLFEIVEDKRKSDGKMYKKLKIMNPKTPSYDFKNFSDDGSFSAPTETKEE